MSCLSMPCLRLVVTLVQVRQLARLTAVTEVERMGPWKQGSGHTFEGDFLGQSLVSTSDQNSLGLGHSSISNQGCLGEGHVSQVPNWVPFSNQGS